jgi:hypothetical protein
MQPDERLPIARIPFTDGTVRPVYEDAAGRPFVIDGGALVYGRWVCPKLPAHWSDSTG